MASEMDLPSWDPVFLQVLSDEPRGWSEAELDESFPPGLAALWLRDAERRGLVQRGADERWRLAEGIVPPRSQHTIQVGLPRRVRRRSRKGKAG
jgi:hypothetical protein